MKTIEELIKPVVFQIWKNVIQQCSEKSGNFLFFLTAIDDVKNWSSQLKIKGTGTCITV